MSDSDEIQRLIRLKRYESPGEEYYESFVEQFKERQRAEMLRGSARSLLFERISMWLDENGGVKRFVPVGAVAAAAIGAGVYFVTLQSEQGQSDLVSDSLVEATVDLSMGEAAASAAFPNSSSEAGSLDETIRLKLPHSTAKVPRFDKPAYHGGELIPVGESFREL